jgi:DNA-binding PadR family transcriptional regulator
MSVRLFILGLLKQQDAHGYELKKKLEEWGMENWANLNWSSVYHALRQMEKEGLIEKKKVVENHNRPAKAVYSILESGKQEFFRLLRETSTLVAVEKNPIYIALMYLHELPDDEKVDLLTQRLTKLQHLQKQVERKEAHLMMLPETPDEVVFALGRDFCQRKADIEWTQTLIDTYSRQK